MGVLKVERIVFIVGRIWEVNRVQGVINREAKVRQKNLKWQIKQCMIPLKKHIFKKIKHAGNIVLVQKATLLQIIFTWL
jgi:hypothetical protein